jgi:CheY-like chemotaxis protein
MRRRWGCSGGVSGPARTVACRALPKSAADEALSVNSYDCAVLDRMLPSGDALRYVQARRPAVPVLFLTARDAVADRIAGLAAGDDLPREAVRGRGAGGGCAGGCPEVCRQC